MMRSRSRRFTAVLAILGMCLGLLAVPASADVTPTGPISFELTGGEIVINGGTVLDPIPLGPCELDPVLFPDPEDDPCDPDADPTSLTGTIASDGTVTIPAANVLFPPLEVDDPLAVLVEIEAADDVTGVIDPVAGTMAMSINLLVNLAFESADCVLTLPINMTGTYNPSTGVGDMTDNTFAIPGLSCDVPALVPILNGALGLPAPSGNSVNMIVQSDPVITEFVPEGAPVIGDVTPDVNLGLGGSATRTIPVSANPPLDSLVVTGGGSLADSVSIFQQGGFWRITYVHDEALGGGTDVVTYEGTNAEGSDTGTMVVHISDNECTAGLPGNPAFGCSLDQFIEFEILGDVLSMEQQESQIGLEEITLNGIPQVTTGDMNTVVVTNRRGDGAPWSLVGQVSDFKVDGYSGENTDCPADDATTWDFRCIPGDNLGWSPAAEVAHQQVPGDVAAVQEGSSISTGDIGNGLLAGSGLGSTPQSLCQAAATTSGGTFACGAALALVVPASASAGTYNATLTLTLS